MKKLTSLKVGAAPIALGIALVASPAFAQDEDSPTISPGAACDPLSDPACADEADPGDTIIVTGSILRTTREEASPITVLDADNLETRGISTVEEAIQNLSANGAGNLPNSFSAQGAFAAGASAASLRGLTTSSTLVLFDGLRGAYYPLADDGTRNFVDLNTIPDAIVDRVEVLKDGASSTYGADAIAGVINVITKKQVEGLHVGMEAGIAQRGYGGSQNIEATYGYGDLVEQGFNVYVSGRYYHEDIIYNRQLRDIYNGGPEALCNEDRTDCVDNTNSLYLQGREFNGDFSGFLYTSLLAQPLTSPYSRNAATGLAAGRTGPYSLLGEPDCNGAPRTDLTPEEQADNILGNSFACVYDYYGTYGVVRPESERINATLRATARLSDTTEAYAQFNFAQSDVSYPFYQASVIRASAPAETGITYNISPLFLPIYLCPGATYDANGNPENNGCINADGTPVAGATLNPNNPYAANGQFARYAGGLTDIDESSRYKTNSYRAAFGVSGEIGEGTYFDIGGTAMKVELDRTLKGRVYIANFLQTVADGSYNFVNPELNSQDVRDFITPTVNNHSTSEMYQLQATVSRDLFELPGGPLAVGLGGSWRHERVNAPGADSDGTLDPDLVDPLQRYTSRVNPFGSIGSRTVWSAFGEINAPIVDMVEVNLSGRYDSYNTGQSNFSPKAAIKVTPIPQVLLRGTYSKGFRIGSFAEFGATPTTGYTPGTNTIPQAIQDQYAAANGGVVPAYITSYSIGLTSEGNPNLDPEKSESVTLGIVAEPIPGVSFSVDYYRIKKTQLITGADYLPALEAYYAGQPIPDGFGIVPDDPALGDQYAGLIPRVQFVQYSFTNKDSGLAEGIDFAASARIPLGGDLTFTTSAEAAYLMELSQTLDGEKQRYDGSIGNYVITSASGAPKWRGSWQNTLSWEKFYVSATAFYVSGYSTSAEDQTGPGTRYDCDASLSAHYYLSGESYQCRVDSFINVNASVGFDVTDKFRFYVNVNNVFDAKAPIDTATYGGHYYNPSWHTPGVIGRSFKAGVKASF